MKIYRWQENLSLPELALTIGNFDGVHRGHQKVLHQLQTVATAHQLQTALMSFFPHPKAVITGTPPPLLTPLKDRAHWLAWTKYLNYWLLQPFTIRLMTLSPEAFIEKYLLPLRVRFLLVGDDFRFGYRGRGNFALLEQLAPQYGFQVQSLSTVTENKARISSSAIRQALEKHDLQKAQNLLGHALTFTGKVRHGDGRGRHLSTPTANLHLPQHWCLPDGVYVVKIMVLSVKQSFYGVANIGITPTFAGKRRKLEAHLFGMADNLYQQTLRVEILHYLRPVKKFTHAAALSAQIQQDIIQAEAFIQEK